jgi:iron-sulfur cluster assembly protein
MFSLSSAAAAQILFSARQAGCEGTALRVAARRMADGGMDYGMGFDDPTDDDLQLEFDGVTVLIGPGSQPLLEGTQLDFVALEPGEPSFIFVPPAGSCGHSAKGTADGCGSGQCGGCRGA